MSVGSNPSGGSLPSLNSWNFLEVSLMRERAQCFGIHTLQEVFLGLLWFTRSSAQKTCARLCWIWGDMPKLYHINIYACCDSMDKLKLNKISNFSVQFFSMFLDDLLKFKVLIFLQKTIDNKEPFYLSNKLLLLSSKRYVNIKSIRYNYLVSEKQFFVFAIRHWNSLFNPY